MDAVNLDFKQRKLCNVFICMKVICNIHFETTPYVHPLKPDVYELICFFCIYICIHLNYFIGFIIDCLVYLLLIRKVDEILTTVLHTRLIKLTYSSIRNDICNISLIGLFSHYSTDVPPRKAWQGLLSYGSPPISLRKRTALIPQCTAPTCHSL